MSIDVMELLKSKIPPGVDIEIPPKIFVEMEGEILEYVEGKSLKVKFPVKEKYQNPLGAMQGGMITAAIDNTFGPLSYLVAPPSATTHLNTTFIRPVTSKDTHIYIEAVVDEITRSQVHMSAKVKNEKGALLVMSNTSFSILK